MILYDFFVLFFEQVTKKILHDIFCANTKCSNLYLNFFLYFFWHFEKTLNNILHKNAASVMSITSLTTNSCLCKQYIRAVPETK